MFEIYMYYERQPITRFPLLLEKVLLSHFRCNARVMTQMTRVHSEDSGNHMLFELHLWDPTMGPTLTIVLNAFV